jgi:hypothetical protein
MRRGKDEHQSHQAGKRPASVQSSSEHGQHLFSIGTLSPFLEIRAKRRPEGA